MAYTCFCSHQQRKIMSTFTLCVIWLVLFTVNYAQGSTFPAAIKTKYETYLKEFDNTRGHIPNTPALDTSRENVRKFMKNKFEAAGLEVLLQNFDTTDTNTGESATGTNVIAILKGSLYKKAEDEVIILAAHTDTPGRNAGGANNDGSGLVGLLTIAEALKGSDSCTRNRSIIFAAFDRAETDVIGNNITQCKKSCGSVEFIKNKATYIGSSKVKLAIVLDCIANYDSAEKSQFFPPALSDYFKSTVENMVASDALGDFLAITGRNDEKNYIDEMEKTYDASRVNPQNSMFFPAKFQWNINGVPTAENKTTMNKAFKDGDHMSFWDASIHAVLLTDTCYDRGNMKDANCKIDKACDSYAKILGDDYKFMYSALLTATKITNKYTCSGLCASCDPSAECKNDVCVCKVGFTGNGNNCTDIDECKQGTSQCNSNAYCRNLKGGYECNCKQGFSGDGRKCTAVSSGNAVHVISQVLVFGLAMLLSYYWI